MPAKPHLDTLNAVAPVGTGSLLERRILAAVIDASLVGFWCTGMFVARTDFFSPQPWLWWPSLTVAAVVASLELFAKKTPGKWFEELSLASRSGSPTSILAQLIRGITRLAPPVLLAISPLLTGPGWQLLAAGSAIALLSCYVTACYLMLVRVGYTMFDSIAGTTLVDARKALS